MALSDGHHLEPVVPIGRARSWGDGTVLRRSYDVPLKQIGCLEADMAPPAGMARALRDILIVDPDPQALLAAKLAVQAFADVEACADFRTARARLVAKPPDLLVTNIRLERFNGLHLVYVAAGSPTRCLVYAREHDPVLAREALAAGAFYERADRLPRVLASYARATALPLADRRNPAAVDRRSLARGGRRSADA
jgi:DNA-binding NtrC family response regulator